MDQAATFKAFPHIGEKVLGYLTNENDFKTGLSVCKSWNEILTNPSFWLKKLKTLNRPDMQIWVNSALEKIDFSCANTIVTMNLRREYFFLKSTKFVCNTCKNGFPTPTILNFHQRNHLFERNFRCETCSVSFRTSGHLAKHKRSSGHFNKVNINATFGEPINHRPFYCADCKLGFRIHGHLAKHLRSKSHILKLENAGKLPIGIYDKLEQSGVNFTLIDTSSNDSALESLKTFAAAL